MDNLRSKVIRLARQNPELRPHLLPLLKTAGEIIGDDAVLKFDIALLADEVEEDAQMGNTLAKSLWTTSGGDPHIRDILRYFARRLRSPEDGTVIIGKRNFWSCYVPIASLDFLSVLRRKIPYRSYKDAVSTGSPYFVAMNFKFYPHGPRGPVYGKPISGQVDGTLEDWFAQSPWVGRQRGRWVIGNP